MSRPHDRSYLPSSASDGGGRGRPAGYRPSPWPQHRPRPGPTTGGEAPTTGQVPPAGNGDQPAAGSPQTGPREAYEQERRQLDHFAQLHGQFAESRRRWLGQWGVAGELLRILTNPYTGRHEARSETVRIALVAGVFTELWLDGWIQCQDTTVEGADGSTTVSAAILVEDRRGRDGALVAMQHLDDAQRWVVERVLDSPRPRSARHWLVDLSAHASQPAAPDAAPTLDHVVEELLARRLVAAGVARREQGRARLGRRRQTRLIAAEQYETAAINAVHRIPRLMSEGRELDTEDVMTAALLDHIGLSRRIRRESTYEHVHLERYVSAVPVPLRRLLRHAYAAFGTSATEIL